MVSATSSSNSGTRSNVKSITEKLAKAGFEVTLRSNQVVAKLGKDKQVEASTT